MSTTPVMPSTGMPGIEQPRAGGPSSLPVTRLGRISMWMAVAFVAMFTVNNAFVGMFGRSDSPDWVRTVMIGWGIFLMSFGFAAGVIGLVAILKHKERSWAVWLSLLPLITVVTFLLGEVLVPH